MASFIHGWDFFHELALFDTRRELALPFNIGTFRRSPPLCFTPDSRGADALGGKLFGNTLLRFDLRSETVTSMALPAEAASIGTTPDGKNVITYGNAIRFFDPDTLEENCPTLLTVPAQFLARYSESGHRIATRDDEAKLRVSDPKPANPSIWKTTRPIPSLAYTSSFWQHGKAGNRLERPASAGVGLHDREAAA